MYGVYLLRTPYTVCSCISIGVWRKGQAVKPYLDAAERRRYEADKSASCGVLWSGR